MVSPVMMAMMTVMAAVVEVVQAEMETVWIIRIIGIVVPFRVWIPEVVGRRRGKPRIAAKRGAGNDSPGSVRLTAGRAVTLMFFIVDVDCLRIFATVQSLPVFVVFFEQNIPGTASIRINPDRRAVAFKRMLQVVGYHPPVGRAEGLAMGQGQGNPPPPTAQQTMIIMTVRRFITKLLRVAGSLARRIAKELQPASCIPIISGRETGLSTSSKPAETVLRVDNLLISDTLFQAGHENHARLSGNVSDKACCGGEGLKFEVEV